MIGHHPPASRLFAFFLLPFVFCYPLCVKGLLSPKFLAGALALVFFVSLAFCYAPLRLATVVVLGRSPHCPMEQAVESYDHALSLLKTKDRILDASRLLETDPAGFRLWDTPKGRYWIPNGDDYVLPFNLSEQENKIYGVGQQAVKAGDIVLDCGANVGVYVREALNSGAKTVIAIEPAPENIECLRRNFETDVAAGRVIIYAKGVWDKDDFLTINVAPDNTAADSFVIQPKGSRKGAKLPLTTIDNLVAELKLPRVDYIKMDIEGAEQRAIIGATETIRKFHPRLSLSAYHRPDDPDKIPALVRAAWPGYKMECGPCADTGFLIRPDVLYFR